MAIEENEQMIRKSNTDENPEAKRDALDNSAHTKLETLFDQATQLSGKDRADFLDQCCKQNPNLRQELEELLHFDEEDQSIIDKKINSDDGKIQLVADSSLPAKIGPFTILSNLGKGGMGEVYLGQQSEPIERKAAIKLVRSGLDSQRVLARFKLEQKTLALMDHSGIAKVFEAGCTEEGRPYFAMEYVKGVAITDYCDRYRLDIPARLALFSKVCLALHHAHQKGVIHRDIKPSNILVSSTDSEALPKLIDFGIAKAMSDSNSLPSHLTIDGQLLGTLDYMSPEQAEFGQHDLDTRSDIYSLGVLLYELLVGSLPFSDQDSQKKSFAENLRQLCEQEPKRPSTRLTENHNTLEHVAKTRGNSTRALASELRGDLDCITMTALQKDRELRYNSAAALASDVNAYLSSEPILAMPASKVYRAKKFVRKNRWAVGLSCVFAGLVFVALLITTSLYQDTKKQYSEIIRLSDFHKLEQIQLKSKSLYPPSSEQLDSLREIYQQSKQLVDRLPHHKHNLKSLRLLALPISEEDLEQQRKNFPAADTLKALQDRVKGINIELSKSQLSPSYKSMYLEQISDCQAEIALLKKEQENYREYHFASDENAWHHKILSKLVRELEEFASSKSADRLLDIQQRYEYTQSLCADLTPTEKSLWAEAIQSIKDSPIYNGLVISPQPGLSPLCQNPQSGLWEFSHQLSGQRPVIQSDGLPISPMSEHSITLVLLPGASFSMGVRKFNYGAKIGTKTCEVFEVSDNCLMDLKAGDIITHFNGKKIGKATDFAVFASQVQSNQKCTYTVNRAGESISGEFTAQDELDHFARSHEGPRHTVKLAPFFISKYELSQAQWSRLTNENPSYYHNKGVHGENRHTTLHPVESVSYTDCKKALKRWGLVLPTEAQWEYSARGNQGEMWFTGDSSKSIQGYGNIADAYAHKYYNSLDWVFDLDHNDSYAATSPIGKYKANPFGLHDTIGNVSEWCLDLLCDYRYAKYREGDGFSSGPSYDEFCVRGGCFWDSAANCRSASRSQFNHDRRSSGTGVRPARKLQLANPSHP